MFWSDCNNVDTHRLAWEYLLVAVGVAIEQLGDFDLIIKYVIKVSE